MKILRKIFYSIGYHFGKGFVSSNQNLKKILSISTKFDLLLNLENEQKKKSFNFFKNYFKNSVILEGRLANLSYSINKSLENIEKEENNSDEKYSFLEFWVFKGETTNYIANKINIYNFKVDAFDSFKGLSEDRKLTNDPKGSYSTNDIQPKLNDNVNLIVGNIFETLKLYLNNSKKKIVFVHIDTDTYETTKFILNNIKPYLTTGSIIVFDELHNFMGWEVGESKALFEIFNENEIEFISFTSGQQATIKIK